MRSVLIIVCIWIYMPAGFSQAGLGSFQQVEVKAGKAEVITSKGRISFQLYQGGVVQTTFDAGYQNSEQISNAVVVNPLPIIRLLTQNDSALVFEAGTMQITVLKQPVRIRYEKDNRVVQCVGADTADGHRLLQFSLNANEKIFGTGSRSIPLNRRGYRLDLDHRPWYGYNINAENLNYSMPFFVSSAHYGIFIDNPSRGYLDIGKSDPTLLTAGFNSGALQFYTFLGNSTGSVVEQFVKLVGTAPLPPRWALGNFMSRFGYRSQDEVMNIARKMQSADFPLDAVIIDLFWFGDGEHTRWNMGNLDWNRNRFPAPEKMMDSLRAMKLKTILITEPFVLSESNNYKETQIKKLNAVTKAGDTTRIKSFYFGDAGLLDIPKNETKDWFWNKYDAQIKKGIDGWWGDLGEPEQHPDDLYHNLTDLGFKRLFKASEVHNIYAHWWSEMLFEKYAKHYPSTRLFHLNRSGYAGSWRYGAIPWSGDVERSWAGLRAQLPIMIGMSLSGSPYMHSDAGGFAMGKRDPELYTRWLQMSVFSPIFRPHGSVNAPDPSIPQIESEPVFYEEPYQSVLRSFVKRRYEMMPYTYQLAYKASKEGTPLVRPLFYYNSSDSNLFKAEDQYMFGDAFLVAPVLQPGAVSRKLYLPNGIWYRFSDHKAMLGGKWIEESVQLSDIPVFVKEGSIVPLMPSFNNIADYFKQPLYIFYYPSPLPSVYQLYEDDGLTKHTTDSKAFELTTIEATPRGKRLKISVQSNKGVYAQRSASRDIILQIPGLEAPPKKALINGKAYPIHSTQLRQTKQHGVFWNIEDEMLMFDVPQYNGDPLVIEIAL